MIECRDLKDPEYYVNCVLSYKHNGLSREEVIKSFKDHFLFGYEVFRNGKREGIAFALKIGDLYTLDGYNEGKSFMGAVIAGKKVRDRLLKEYTDTIYTAHYAHEEKVTMLAKLLGFKEVEIIEDRRVLKIGG
jgi:hypothetical protein